jgi:hypothetical protein
MERTVNDHLSDTSDKSTASASVDTYAAELTDVMERMDEALQDIAPWRVMHKMLDRGQEGLAEAKAILDDPDKLAAFIAANADDHQSDTSRKKIDQTEDKAERKRQQRREAQRRYREKITGKPQGRTRSTVEEMRERRDALYGIVREQQPMTVRQVFYQATVRNLVPKSQAGYEMVAYDLANMRKGGELPYGWIADNTRWMRKPRTFDSMQEALQDTARFYRRGLWSGADCYVEIWLEKDALSGVIFPVTSEYDVPLMVARGYASLSFLNSAAEAMAEEDRPCYIYQLGDHDPSGVDAARHIEERLREMAPNAEIYFERIAVTPEQIAEWNLPSRPTKTSDPRTKNWEGGESVELDAISPDDLRQLVRDCIEQHIDRDRLDELKDQEAREKEMLAMFAKQQKAA